MKRKFQLIICSIAFSIVATAQSVGINNNAPHSSAILDITSINKGVLVPRMNSSQRTGIGIPAAGLLVYDTDTNSFWFYNGIAWANLSASGTTGWLLTGNNGINPANNFIGTTDTQPLRFRVNNLWAGEIHATNGNIFLGMAAGQANAGGQLNTALGIASLKNNFNSNENVAIGDSTLFFHNGSTGGGNTAVGTHSMYSSTNGNVNTALGYYSLWRNTDGGFNTAIGVNTLSNNISGDSNTAVGARALQFTTGSRNTATGASALRFNSFANDNTANGFESLYSNTSGLRNTASGSYTLHLNSDGSGNTADGWQALNNNTTGDANTAVGVNALFANTTAGQNTAIGYQALQNQYFENGGVSWISGNVAIGYGALYFNQPTSISNGIYNTAIGHSALYNNNTGYSNTANGFAALYSNQGGYSNTASGQGALYYNTNGSGNTANGYAALNSNTTGTSNTAVGRDALHNNTLGTANIAVGSSALYFNTTASSNIAIGNSALEAQSFNNGGSSWTSGNVAIGDAALMFNAPNSQTTGVYNTALGYAALGNNITGSGNTALGYNSGPNTGALSNTTCIGNGTIASANNQMVLGNVNVTQFYCYGAFVGTTANASNLTVLNTGQIVRSTSSRRYKKDIVPIDINTASIYQLRPVSYNSYTDDSRHFGLIAEEVAEIIPELASFEKEKDVVKGSSSDKMIPDAVQYPLLSVLLLKEVQKHEKTINELQDALTEMKKMLIIQQAQIDALKK